MNRELIKKEVRKVLNEISGEEASKIPTKGWKVDTLQFKNKFLIDSPYSGYNAFSPIVKNEDGSKTWENYKLEVFTTNGTTYKIHIMVRTVYMGGKVKTTEFEDIHKIEGLSFYNALVHCRKITKDPNFRWFVGHNYKKSYIFRPYKSKDNFSKSTVSKTKSTSSEGIPIGKSSMGSWHLANRPPLFADENTVSTEYLYGHMIYVSPGVSAYKLWNLKLTTESMAKFKVEAYASITKTNEKIKKIDKTFNNLFEAISFIKSIVRAQPVIYLQDKTYILFANGTHFK